MKIQVNETNTRGERTRFIPHGLAEAFAVAFRAGGARGNICRVPGGLILALLLAAMLCPPYVSDAASLETEGIDIPHTVGIGQPFLVRLAFPYLVDAMEITWNERSVKPTVSHENGSSHAIALLGTRLKMEPCRMPIQITVAFNGQTEVYEQEITIVPHEYQEEALSLEPRLVTPPEEVKDRIHGERELALQAINTVSPDRMWEVPFSLPVKGKMLSRFGLYRVYNGDVRARHKGLDFRAYLGTPVSSIAPGKVVLVGDFYFAGNCVYIDHGNGVVSNYVHLSSVSVQEGDILHAGQEIGLSGSTGRATGAHLHLGVFVQGVCVDPEPLFTLGEQ